MDDIEKQKQVSTPSTCGQTWKKSISSTSSFSIKSKIEILDQKSLSWKNISYSIPTQQKSTPTKQILNNISGFIENGHVLAIMGPTGSGKTTLLSVLGGRLKYLKGAMLSGEVFVDDQPRKHRSFAKLAAFVTQDDILYSHLTVYETLMTAASFSFSSSATKEEKEEFVSDVIRELGLSKARDTIIGDERTRGISGGERKRVNIGVELISQPTILFLDEPTSGLDSFQAFSVMEVIKSMAENGRTILASVHQPRSSIYSLFDKILLLSEGKIIYSGLASDAMAYFDRLGYECPKHYNPADFFLDLISHDFRSNEAENDTTERVQSLVIQWKEDNKDGCELVQTKTCRSSSFITEPNPKSPEIVYIPKIVSEESLASKTSFRSSWGEQFYILLLRSWRQIIRSKFAITLKIIVSIFFSCLLGSIYSELDHSQKSIQDRIGLLFFVCINQGFTAMFPVLRTFPKERKIILKERAGKCYHISAYYIAKLISEIPYHIIGPIVFGTLVYWIVGLKATLVAFLNFLGILLLETNVALSVGMIISCVAPTEEIAQILGPSVFVVFFLFSGFYINLDSIPIGAHWLTYISFFKWALEGLVVNEFTGESFHCNDNDGTCITTGEQVIDQLAFDSTIPACAKVLFYQLICWNVLAFITLRFKKDKFQILTS